MLQPECRDGRQRLTQKKSTPHCEQVQSRRITIPAKPKKGLNNFVPNCESNCSHVRTIASLGTFSPGGLPLLCLYIDWILLANWRLSESRIPYFLERSSNSVIVLGLLVNCHNAWVCLRVCTQSLNGREAWLKWCSIRSTRKFTKGRAKTIWLTGSPNGPMPTNCCTYSSVCLSDRDSTVKEHVRQGFKVPEGLVVFDISACIGASPKWHKTSGMTRTSACTVQS